MKDTLSLIVADTSSVAEVRGAAATLAAGIGMSDAKRSDVSIVATEAATNLLKHAKGGEILLHMVQADGAAGVEIISLDKGPGIANVAEALRDGYSTAAGSGTGLGAMKRMSDVFDVYSVPGEGTVLLARLYASPPRESRGPCLEVDVICLPKPGEEASGDGWGVVPGPDRCLLMVVDGLGHGPLAAEAALAAMSVFHENPQAPPAELLQIAHTALRATRGAAMSIAEVRHSENVVRYAGIGDIAGVILTGEGSRHMVSFDGLVGENMRKVVEFTYEWSRKAVLVMHSDGLATHWKLETRHGLLSRHPGVIAGVLCRDYNRRRDDVTVLVAKPADAALHGPWRKL